MIRNDTFEKLKKKKNKNLHKINDKNETVRRIKAKNTEQRNIPLENRTLNK